MSDLQSARYGRAATRSRTRVAAVISGLIGLLALTWLIWVISDQVRPQVTSALSAYDVKSDHEVTATLRVRLADTDVQATCLVRAFADDHTVVGEANLRVPTTAGTSITVPVSIRTERRATSVEGLGCTAPGQKHAR